MAVALVVMVVVVVVVAAVMVVVVAVMMVAIVETLSGLIQMEPKSADLLRFLFHAAVFIHLKSQLSKLSAV